MIHPTAVIHPNAKIGKGTTVGPAAIVEEHVEIGDNCEIQAHAVITGHTRLGSNNRVGYGAIIGGEPQDLSFDRSTVSFVEIGDGNVFREYVTVHRGTKPDSKTVVGNNCFLMAGAHLAHNVQVDDGAILANNVLCAGYAQIGARCFIGGGAVIHQFTRIGRLSLMQGLAGISKDLPPFMVAAGVNTLAGLNTVGLRRAGLDPAARKAVRKLYHDLFLSENNLSQALASLDRSALTTEQAEVIAFIEQCRKGVLMPGRLASRHGGDAEGE